MKQNTSEITMRKHSMTAFIYSATHYAKSMIKVMAVNELILFKTLCGYCQISFRLFFLS